MDITIKRLKELSEKYKLGTIIIFARNDNGQSTQIVSYGRTAEQSSRAAIFANKLKVALGWPERLYSDPSRIKRYQKEIKGLKDQIKNLINHNGVDEW